MKGNFWVKKATWPYVPRSAMVLAVTLKTKVLPAYREHNMHDLNTICTSEFKKLGQISVNGHIWPLSSL